MLAFVLRPVKEPVEIRNGLPGGDPIRGGTGNARPTASRYLERAWYQGRDYLAVIPFGGRPAMPALEPALRAFFFYARPPASRYLERAWYQGRDYLAVIPFGGRPAMPALEPALRAFFFWPPAGLKVLGTGVVSREGLPGGDPIRGGPAMPALEPALRAFFFWPPPLARASFFLMIRNKPRSTP